MCAESGASLEGYRPLHPLAKTTFPILNLCPASHLIRNVELLRTTFHYPWWGVQRPSPLRIRGFLGVGGGHNKCSLFSCIPEARGPSLMWLCLITSTALLPLDILWGTEPYAPTHLPPIFPPDPVHRPFFHRDYMEIHISKTNYFILSLLLENLKLNDFEGRL